MNNEKLEAGLTSHLTHELGALLPKEPISLKELKSRPCSLEELQGFLIKLTELYNEQGFVMEAAINGLRQGKQDREWRANM